jgi:hypothetical protein
MSRITHVIPKDDYCLEVVIDDGSSVMIDFKSRLHTLRFSLLSDKEYFNTVTTDGTCVLWNYKIEISLSEVFELAQK